MTRNLEESNSAGSWPKRMDPEPTDSPYKARSSLQLDHRKGLAGSSDVK